MHSPPMLCCYSLIYVVSNVVSLITWTLSACNTVALAFPATPSFPIEVNVAVRRLCAAKMIKGLQRMLLLPWEARV